MMTLDISNKKLTDAHCKVCGNIKEDLAPICSYKGSKDRCLSCQRELKNRKHREWYQANRESQLAKDRAYKAKLSPDRICTGCHVFRRSEFFSKNTYTCKLCNTYYHASKSDQRKKFNTCTLQEWINVSSLSKCQYCKREVITACDRIDNTKGHEKDNIVACCSSCNYTRTDLYTYDEMLNIIGPALQQLYLRRNNE